MRQSSLLSSPDAVHTQKARQAGFRYEEADLTLCPAVRSFCPRLRKLGELVWEVSFKLISLILAGWPSFGCTCRL